MTRAAPRNAPTGLETITATLAWHVRYRIGRGAWTDLTGPALSGPTGRHGIRALEARGVLVPDPDGR